MKMPEPTMPPMTIMVASKVFRLRGGVGVAKGARIAEDAAPEGSKFAPKVRRESEEVKRKPHKIVKEGKVFWHRSSALGDWRSGSAWRRCFAIFRSRFRRVSASASLGPMVPENRHCSPFYRVASCPTAATSQFAKAFGSAACCRFRNLQRVPPFALL